MNKVEIAQISMPKIEDMYGVLAQQDVAIGEIAYEFSDHTIVKERTYTSIQISKTKHIEDFVGKFFNHSCSPNLEFVAKEIVNNAALYSCKKEFYMKAIHAIRKGDELTFDYRTTESEIVRPFICKCCNKEISTDEVQRIS